MENIFATFLQTAGLYDSKEICEDNIADLIELLKGNVKISAYCKECKQERVFHMKPIEYYFETGPEGDEEIRCASLGEEIESLQNMIFSTKARQEKSSAEEWKWINWQIADTTRLMKLEYICSMDEKHHLDYIILTTDNSMMKIGQYPSIADMTFPELDAYKHVISKQDRKELGTAITQAHRNMIDEFAQNEAIQSINEKISAASTVMNGKLSLSADQGVQNSWESSLVTQVDGIPFAHAGKGAQCIIKTQLALSHKQAEKASIILIEEPESHLSFSRLSELMGVIEKAASGRQIIASTHSSFVANKLGLENLILLSGDNCCSMQSLKKETFEFFKKVAGYDTLRLILCKKSILVEGDSDELVVQRAYMDTHEGRLPIQDGIDVMTVGGVTFKRYLEIAQTLNKETAVVTDNDGNIEAVKKKYKEYEEIQCIHICVDEVVDTGDLKLSGKDFNYNTLEPKILKENGREAMNNIFGTNYDTDDEMHKYMHAHKTDCAIAIFESATKIKYPEYIMRAIKNE